MKQMKQGVVICLLIMFCAMPCYGAQEVTEGQNATLDEFYDQVQEYDVDTSGDLKTGIADLVQKTLSAMDTVLRGAIATAVRLLLVCILCAMAQSIGGETQNATRTVLLAGALAITALSISEVGSMLSLGRAAISQIHDFSNLVLPVMAMLTAATGNVTTAALVQGVTVGFSGVLIALIDGIFIPFIYVYIAVCCANAALDNEGLKRIANLIKGAVVGALSTVMLCYIAYLSVTGAIAGSADAATVKAAKLAISRAIPVVGGIISDAAETILVSASVLRASVGVVGLLVVLCISLAPFLYLGMHYLTYKVVAAVSATVADGRLTALIDQIAAAFGLLLAMLGSCALLLLISIVSAVTAVGG